MGTRSRVGIQNEDKSVTSIYIHWDGYPEYLGEELNENLLTEELVRNYLAEGDRSTFELSYKEMRNEDCPSNTHPAKDWPDSDQEYQYLFVSGKWEVKKLGIPLDNLI